MAVSITLPEYGGYDHDFIDNVPEKFICTICSKVLRDPHLTGCCGQHYCESCLTHWFRMLTMRTCPHCRQVNIAHMRNKALKREISQLKVHCTLRKNGCTWQGELGDLQTHLDSDTGCDFVEVECPNKCIVPCLSATIPMTLKRKDIASHLRNSCYLRMYKCEHCNLEGTYVGITGKGAPDSRRKRKLGFDPHPDGSHYSECAMIQLDCPNMCGVKKIKRKDIHAHRETCPMEKLACPNECQEGQCWVFNPFRGKVVLMFNRKDLIRHLRSQCYLRKYTCEHCGHEDTYQAITGRGGPQPISFFHYVTCPEKPLDCPNNCGAMEIKRKDMPTHREQCPLEPVQCPFQEAGCQTRLVRRDLDNHMATQTQQHLLLTFQTMKERCDNLSQENVALKQELQTLKNRQGFNYTAFGSGWR